MTIHTVTEETRRKMSISQTGRKHRPESIIKMSLARKGKPLKEKTREKLSEYMKIQWSDEEYRKKMTDTHKGKKMSEEAKKKMSINRKGKPLSKETRLKISETLKKKHPFKGKVGPRLRQKPSKESREKMSKSHIGKRRGPESSNWKGGTSFGKYCTKWRDSLREEIRNKHGRKCFACGLDEKDNKYKSGKQVRLIVHHVDEDKEQGCNGKSWRLVPLCIRCHAKTLPKKGKYYIDYIKDLIKLYDIKEFMEKL